MSKFKLTFKTIAFKCLIFVVVINVAVAYYTYKSTSFETYNRQILVFGVLAAIFLYTGIVMGLISYLKKEKGDYEKYLGFFGNIVFLIVGIIIEYF